MAVTGPKSALQKPWTYIDAEPLWTDPGIKSGISVHELLATQKKKKKNARAGNEWSNILPKSSQATRKASTLVQIHDASP